MKRFLIALLSLLIAPSHEALSQSISCTSTSSTQYVNSWGYSYISADAYSRYVYQYMYWHDSSRLSWFSANANSTWELDTFFYNYDGRAYGNAPSGYWASDMPYPYVDTQAFDPSAEKAVTVGSANAAGLSAGRVYYYVTRMTSGAGSSSLVKLQAQRGLRSPSWCYSTWCSFGCSTASNYERVVPFQAGYYAPGCRRYWWQWWITTNEACPL